MSIFSNLFGKKENDAETPKKGVEDFMSFIRIYLEAAMAAGLGITNIRMLPELAAFKRVLKIQTVNNKLGVAEKAKAKKILMSDFGLGESFFDELDASLKKGCKSQMAMQSYSFKFQEFLQNLMTLVSNQMQWKMQVPLFMKGTLKTLTEETVHNIMTKPMWKKQDVMMMAFNVRKQAEALGLSEKWMSEFVFTLIVLAKKEKRKKKKD